MNYPVSEVAYAGSSYAEYIKRTGSTVPGEPVLFIKLKTALYDPQQPLAISSDFGSVHRKVELAVSIGATLRQAMGEYVRKAITGYGVVLDLTLRDVQGKMKKVGQPWEKAEAFDSFCSLSRFIPATEFTGDLQNTTLGPNVDDEQRQ